MNVHVQEYLDKKRKNNMAANTIMSYKGDMNKYAAWLKDNKIDYLNITEAQADEYMEHLIFAEGCASSTANRKKCCIRGFYQLLEKKELIEKNPFRRAEIPKQKKRKKEIKDDQITLEEIGIVLNKTKSLKKKTLFAFMGLCGLRISEACALRLSDIKGDTIIIREENGKSGYGEVYMTEQMIDIFNDYMSSGEFNSSESNPEQFLFTHDKLVIDKNTASEWCEIFGITVDDIARHDNETHTIYEFRKLINANVDVNLILNSSYERMESSEICRVTGWRWFKKACKDAGIVRDSYQTHHLRKGHATFLYKEGVDVKVIQQQLRHADPLTTMRMYVRAEDSQMRDQIKGLKF